MIIWRGWGILSVLLALVGLAAGAAIGTPLGSESFIPLAMGAGLLLGGVGGAALGWWLNMVRPTGQIDQQREQLRAQLHARVQVGEFQAAPGVPAPRSPEEAHQQIEAVVAQYEPDFAKLRNRNSVFWIPMQWVSIALGALGVVIMVIGVVGLLTG